MYRNEVQIQKQSLSSAKPKGRNIQVEISSSDSEESKLSLPEITTKNIPKSHQKEARSSLLSLNTDKTSDYNPVHLSKLNVSRAQKHDRRSLSASPNKPFLGGEGLQSNSTASQSSIKKTQFDIEYEELLQARVRKMKQWREDVLETES